MSAPIDGLSLFHPKGHLARPANPFGKDIANAALFRGLVNHGGFAEVAVLIGWASSLTSWRLLYTW